MSNDVNELKKGYRDIKAPAHLATRIRAEVADRPLRSHGWMPAAASVMAVVLVVWLLPFIAGPPQPEPGITGKPSLTAITALKPDAPAPVSVSLSQLRTVKIPKLPPKPALKATKPQTNMESESDLLEEKDYVFS